MTSFIQISTLLVAGVFVFYLETVGSSDLLSSQELLLRKLRGELDPSTNQEYLLRGTSLDSDGYVTAINWSDYYQTNATVQQAGVLNDTICNFTRLSAIDISGLQVSGSIPSCVRNLVFLESMILRNNSLGGPLPDVFQNLSSLSVLDLSWNYFTGSIPESLLLLPSLRKLNLTLNFFEGQLPETIGNLGNLSTLDLAFNNFTGELPSSFRKLTSLSHLNLGFNNFSGSLETSLQNLTKLQVLDLTSNSFSEVLPFSWNQFSNLQTLIAKSNKFSGLLPGDLGSLRSLQKLDLSGNAFSGSIPASFGSLDRLEFLDLSGNFLTGMIPTTFQNLGSACGFGGCLTHLNLQGNFLRGPFREELTNLSSLRYLNLKRNQFSGTIPSSIESLRNLTLLDVSFNGFGNSLPASLSALVKLKILSGGNNNFVGPLPSLNRSTALFSLDLSFNQFRGPIPEGFVGPFTIIIHLNNNLLEGGVHFFSGDSFQELILDDNLLSGTIPSINASVLSLRNNLLTGLEGGAPAQEILRLSGNPLCQDPQSPICSETAGLSLEMEPFCRTNVCAQNGTANNYLRYKSEGACNCERFVNLTVQLASPPFLAVTPSALSALSGSFSLWISTTFGPQANQVLQLWVSSGAPTRDCTIVINVIAFLEASVSDLLVLRLGEYILNHELYLGDAFGPILVTAPLRPPERPGNSTTTSTVSGSDGKFPLWVLAPISVSITLLVLLALWITTVHLYYASGKFSRMPCNQDGTPTGGPAVPSPFALRVQLDSVRPIALEELRAATENFSERNIVGSGSYGTVLKGTGPVGQEWAVKRTRKLTSRSLGQFQKEVAILSRVSHTNLVKLIGFCDESGEQILVYEFMSGGTLKARLHPVDPKDSLSFEKRLSIATGVAEGLHYLHSFQSPAVVHRDIKSENILLDSSNNAKIGDFGFLKNLSEDSNHDFTEAMGTPGYIDPEYYHTLRVTTKSDVYSYGVVLLELITGRKSILKINDSRDTNLQITITNWVTPLVETEQKLEIVDPHLKDNFSVPVMLKLVDIAMDCVQRSSEHRPEMRTVARRLAEIGGQPRSKTMRRRERSTPAVFVSTIESGDGDSMCTPPMSSSFSGR